MKKFQSPSLKENIISFVINTYVTCFSIFLIMFILNIEKTIPFLIAATIVTSFLRTVVATAFIEALIFGNKEKSLESLSFKKYIYGLLHSILVYAVIIAFDRFVVRVYFEPISMGIIFELISLVLNKLYEYLGLTKS